jgi:hypothetical protein
MVRAHTPASICFTFTIRVVDLLYQGIIPPSSLTLTGDHPTKANANWVPTFTQVPQFDSRNDKSPGQSTFEWRNFGTRYSISYFHFRTVYGRRFLPGAAVAGEVIGDETDQGYE